MLDSVITDYDSSNMTPVNDENHIIFTTTTKENVLIVRNASIITSNNLKESIDLFTDYLDDNEGANHTKEEEDVLINDNGGIVIFKSPKVQSSKVPSLDSDKYSRINKRPHARDLLSLLLIIFKFTLCTWKQTLFK